MIWYTPDIDTIDYEYDDTNPNILKLTKIYKDIRFDPTLLTEVQIKVNQQLKSKMINHYSDLMRVKIIEEPGEPFTPED